MEGKQLTRGFTSSKWQSLVPGARPLTTGPAPSLVLMTRLCALDRGSSMWIAVCERVLGPAKCKNCWAQRISTGIFCRTSQGLSCAIVYLESRMGELQFHKCIGHKIPPYLPATPLVPPTEHLGTNLQHMSENRSFLFVFFLSWFFPSCFSYCHKGMHPEGKCPSC